MTDVRKEHERRLGIRASVAWPGDMAGPACVSEHKETASRSTLAVTLLRKAGVLSGFEVSGHARFGAPGQDIVCAGVSAIAQAVEYALDSLPTTVFHAQKRSGHLSLEVVNPWATDSMVAGMLRVAEHGFKGIAESYPGWLSVKYEEVG